MEVNLVTVVDLPRATSESPQTTNETPQTTSEAPKTTSEKVFGDLSKDLPQAAYLLVAGVATELLYNVVQDKLPDLDNKLPDHILKQVVGYTLAAAVELLPGDVLQQQRRQFAHMARVLSASEVGFKLGRFGVAEVTERIDRWADDRVAGREADLNEEANAVADRVMQRFAETIQRLNHRLDRIDERLGGHPEHPRS
jgi:hypothetical protein